MSQMALSIVSMLALSAMLFKFAEHADLSKIRWIHPVFQARLVSSIIFCLPVYAYGKADYLSYLITFFQQFYCQSMADIASSPCNKYSHDFGDFNR